MCLALRRVQRIEREVNEAEEARAACTQGPHRVSEFGALLQQLTFELVFDAFDLCVDFGGGGRV